MLCFDPSASVIVGFSTQILSSLILKESTLWGIIVGSISLFSSIIFCSSCSMKLLNEATLEPTRLFSSKYFLIRSSDDLRINDTSIEDRISSCRAFPVDLYHISCLDVKLSYRRIVPEYLRKFAKGYTVSREQLSLLFLAEFSVLLNQNVFCDADLWLSCHDHTYELTVLRGDFLYCCFSL